MTDEIQGTIERVTFYNPEAGWSVLKVKVKKKMTTVLVNYAKPAAGLNGTFRGEWVKHPKFGRQFKAQEFIEEKPSSIEGIEKYLASGLVKGIGPATAKKIVKKFGDKTLDILENRLEDLLVIPGISKKKLVGIKESWGDYTSVKELIIFLQSHGLNANHAVKINKEYGERAKELVEENPYRVARDIFGIGFLSADKLALSMGIEEEGALRINAGITQALWESRDLGHCYLHREQVYQHLHNLIGVVNHEKIDQQLKWLKDEEKIIVIDDMFFHPKLFRDESIIATRVKELVRDEYEIEKQKTEEWVRDFCDKNNIFPSDEQLRSILKIPSHGFSILTGGPGCGKTTTINILVKLLEAMKYKIFLAAPTGRASQRMSEVIGKEAKTIHRLLEFNPQGGGFLRNKNNPLECDFLIVDECSMLDIQLAASLFNAISNETQVLFIGDPDQLPSVGAGNVLRDIIETDRAPTFRLTKVFRQAEASSIIKWAHTINKGYSPELLSPIERPSVWDQKEDCLFIDSAEMTVEQSDFVAKIKNTHQKGGDIYAIELPSKFKNANLEKIVSAEGKSEELLALKPGLEKNSTLKFGMTALKTVERVYTKTIGEKKGPLEIQVLSPQIRGSLGTQSINKTLQLASNPLIPGKREIVIGDKVLRMGDRVIQTRNNYELGVFNGDIGKILDIDEGEGECVVEFAGEQMINYTREQLFELQLAYAITIHKSQGSEFDVVVIPITTQHYNMLFRNLIYTGLTRAKKLVVFIGDRRALSMAIKNVDNNLRQTFLKELILLS